MAILAGDVYYFLQLCAATMNDECRVLEQTRRQDWSDDGEDDGDRAHAYAHPRFSVTISARALCTYRCWRTSSSAHCAPSLPHRLPMRKAIIVTDPRKQQRSIQLPRPPALASLAMWTGPVYRRYFICRYKLCLLRMWLVSTKAVRVTSHMISHMNT
jgi:hypothetical protein